MIHALRHRAIPIATIGYVLLLLPPLRHLLESRMFLQMLVQMPLLVVIGYLLRGGIPRRLAAIIDPWNGQGITGLLLASLTGMFWMLPRSLDAAVGEASMEAAKFISIPLLIGLPIGLGWPRAGFVVRGVFLAELIATCFRLGWLYMVSPIRLCNSFLLGDQQRSGTYMMVIGAAILLYVISKLMWGRIDSR